MGCDIHCYVESKDDNGTWRQEVDFVSDYTLDCRDIEYFQQDKFTKHAEAPFDDRNYSLFAFLAGVRRDNTPCLYYLTPPGEVAYAARGLPDDISPTVNAEALGWDCDGHTHSWLTLRELVAGFTAATLDCTADGFEDVVPFAIDQLKARSKDGEGNDVRIVFWFDN